MDRPRVHYEVLAQRAPGAAFVLDSACEGRAQAIEAAELLVVEGRALCARVSKEVMRPDDGQFSSVIVFEAGAPQKGAVRKARASQTRSEASCVSPHDLYGLHARETIGRLLEAWLLRAEVTVWELIHRPDLLETLEASGTEIQHALQKIAVPEAQASGATVHEVMRAYKALVDRAVERVMKDGRRGAFPDLAREPLAAVAQRLSGNPERAYLLGGAIAAVLKRSGGWDSKVEALLDQAEAALAAGPAGAAVLPVVEAPLNEMLEGRAPLRDLLGVEGDLGADLIALTRLAAGREVAAVAARDPRLAASLPELAGAAVRLSRFFDAGAFDNARRAVARRILRELAGPRRLRPSSVEGEIEALRVLAMALTATGDRLMDLEDVRRAFVERSRSLLSPEFVGAYLANRAPLGRADALVWLSENVAGAANKRAAARLLYGALGREMELALRATGGEPPAVRLAGLARLQAAVRAADFQTEDETALTRRVGELAGEWEAETGLVTAVARADAEVSHRLFLLAKLASGESAPAGPVTVRARAEAMKLMRTPEARAKLSGSPELTRRLLALLPEQPVAA